MSIPTTIIETDRLLLKEINPQVIHHIFTKSTVQEQMEFFGCQTEAEHHLVRERFLQKFVSNLQWSYKNWYLIEKMTGQVIGDGGFHLWSLPHRRAELGYALNADVHKRKGYMSEALPEMIRIAFEEMDLFRIEAFIGPDNTASQRLVEKLGFKQEAYMTKRYLYQEQLTDLIVYRLLRPEYNVVENETKHSVEQLVRRFENRTLPGSDWTHEAHLSVAFWYLYHFDFYSALCKIRSGIITYNIASGVQNTLVRGYHETMTQFWLKIIDEFLKGKKNTLNFEEAFRAFLNSSVADKNLPLEYYSQEELKSIKARAMWVEPDKQLLANNK